jgi:hypothetical protein
MLFHSYLRLGPRVKTRRGGCPCEQFISAKANQRRSPKALEFVVGIDCGSERHVQQRVSVSVVDLKDPLHAHGAAFKDGLADELARAFDGFLTRGFQVGKIGALRVQQQLGSVPDMQVIYGRRRLLSLSTSHI